MCYGAAIQTHTAGSTVTIGEMCCLQNVYCTLVNIATLGVYIRRYVYMYAWASIYREESVYDKTHYVIYKVNGFISMLSVAYIKLLLNAFAAQMRAN